MPSPVRRSARGVPPAKPAPTSNSSTSSFSSARQDRNTRSNNGHHQAATPRSLSSEERSEPLRRSQRSHPAAREEDAAHGNGNEEALDDKDITRCICGHQEYPGPPLSEVFSRAEAQGEDVGGLFIQCDGCSVWQHGGCVGILEESQSPDKYYCEECRPKLHDQHTDSRGQHYSNYLPLHPQARPKGSVSKDADKAKKDRESVNPRASADPATGRRRGTMRSKEHDDEEEQLRIALEESKREAEGPGGRRNGKRERDESEDTKHDVKRQRTASESITFISRTATVDDESDDDTPSGSRAKKARAEAAQAARQAEIRVQARAREKARSDAAGRRQERAGRRRADDTEPPEDTPKDTNSARTSAPPPSQPPSPPVPDKVPQKKGPAKKTKKLGNNQYTKARELSHHPSTSSPHSKKRQLANTSHGAGSGDEQLRHGDAHTKHSPGAHENGNGNGKTTAKLGKAKNKLLNGLAASKGPVDVNDLSLADMERAMDSMSVFMARAQVDMASDRTPPGSNVTVPSSGGTDGMLSVAGGAVQSPSTAPATRSDGEPMDMDRYNQLSAMEMADELSRTINKWKSRYGKQAQVQT